MCTIKNSRLKQRSLLARTFVRKVIVIGNVSACSTCLIRIYAQDACELCMSMPDCPSLSVFQNINRYALIFLLYHLLFIVFFFSLPSSSPSPSLAPFLRRIDNNYINYLIDYFLSTRNHLCELQTQYFFSVPKPNKSGLYFTTRCMRFV